MIFLCWIAEHARANTAPGCLFSLGHRPHQSEIEGFIDYHVVEVFIHDLHLPWALHWFSTGSLACITRQELPGRWVPLWGLARALPQSPAAHGRQTAIWICRRTYRFMPYGLPAYTVDAWSSAQPHGQSGTAAARTTKLRTISWGVKCRGRTGVSLALGVCRPSRRVGAELALRAPKSWRIDHTRMWTV